VVISQVRDPFEHTIMWHVSTATVSVRVQARARGDEVVALRDGVLVVRVSAPALDGRETARSAGCWPSVCRLRPRG
jgi:hypothetical protein